MDELEQPTMAFIRLSEGRFLEGLVALPIPVRFAFVLLGPSKPDYNYHEIGRSISTLMADKVCCCAYNVSWIPSEFDGCGKYIMCKLNCSRINKRR